MRTVTFTVVTADDAFDLIALVNKHQPNVALKGVSKSDLVAPDRRKKDGSRRSSNQDKFPNTRRGWTKEEDDIILELEADEFFQRETLNELVETLGRTRSAITSRRWRLENPKG